MDKTYLVRFSDSTGELKADAKKAAKAQGAWFYDWVADAIREKLERGKCSQS